LFVSLADEGVCRREAGVHFERFAALLNRIIERRAE
jgi:hypothetical protein